MRFGETSVIPGAEPIDLRAGNTHAVVLLHGFGDTPQTLAALADALHRPASPSAIAYDVRVPLLPGHGTSVHDLDRTSHRAMIDAARAELVAARARYEWVALGGLSMGGAIAAILAAELRDLPSLVLIAPYVAMPAWMRIASASAPVWSDRVGPISANNPRSIRDEAARGRSLSYGTVTGRGVRELAAIVRMSRRALGRVTAPTLLIQSEEDNRVPARVARWALSRIGARRTRLVLTRGAGHVVTVDYGRERVFEEVRAWLESDPGTALQSERPA